MIKYLGSKRTLIPQITDTIQALGGVKSITDLFSGTARVGHGLKGLGYRIHSNDILAYAHTLAHCYVEADRPDVIDDASAAIEVLNALPGKPGFFTETYCIQSRFFQPENGARVDAMRDYIDTMDLTPDVRAVVLVSLMEAADRVDSTTGLQMAYVKQWAPRSFNPIRLRLPSVLAQGQHGKSRATCMDATLAAANTDTDLAYLDPPYNQHSYLGNYHIWETLVRWDAPEVYGTACKRIDCRTRKSPYNTRRTFATTMDELIQAISSPYILVSFSDEGFIPKCEMIRLLAKAGDVHLWTTEYARYVGARIGIHNPSGDKVGTIGKLRNREHLFLCARQPLTNLERRILHAQDGWEFDVHRCIPSEETV